MAAVNCCVGIADRIGVEVATFGWQIIDDLVEVAVVTHAATVATLLPIILLLFSVAVGGIGAGMLIMACVWCACICG